MAHRGSFERLQARFNLIPIEMADDDQEGYIFLCDVILQEEDWTELEYLTEAIHRGGLPIGS
jgi:hypothetical protein